MSPVKTDSVSQANTPVQNVVVLCPTIQLCESLSKHFNQEVFQATNLTFIGGFDTLESIVKFVSTRYKALKDTDGSLKKDRYILVASGQRGHRHTATALAVAMARLGFSANVIAKKGRTPEELLAKIFSTLAQPTISEDAIGDEKKYCHPGKRSFGTEWI